MKPKSKAVSPCFNQHSFSLGLVCEALNRFALFSFNPCRARVSLTVLTYTGPHFFSVVDYSPKPEDFILTTLEHVYVVVLSFALSENENKK